MGTAFVGSVLVSKAIPTNHTYTAALFLMTIFGIIGLGAALLIPRDAIKAPGESIT